MKPKVPVGDHCEEKAQLLLARGGDKTVLCIDIKN